MRPITKSLLLSCCFAFLSQSVFAEDDEVSIVGGAAYSFKRTQFDISGKAFKPEYTTIEWSVIAAYQSFYVKAGFDQSIKDHVQINNTPSGGGGSNDNSGIAFSRDDINITFGYSLLDNLSLFAGYTQGETVGVLGGQMRVDSSFPFTLAIPQVLFTTQEVSFKQKGPYLGVSYSYYLQDSGSFNFSLAYASLDGDVFFKETSTQISPATAAGNPGDVTNQVNEVDGESTGLSYGVTWTDQFSEGMLYSLSLKTVRYKFEEPSLGPDNLNFDDIYNIFSIGFSKFF